MTSHNPSSFSTEKQAKTDFRPKNVCIRAYFLLLKAGRDADAHGNTLQSCFGYCAQIRQMSKLTGLSTEFLRLTVIF